MKRDAIRPSGDQSFLGRVFDSYQNMTQIASCLVNTFRALDARLADRLTASSKELDLLRAEKDAADMEIGDFNSVIRRLRLDNERAKEELGRLRAAMQEF
jgi:hypothetical protein